MTMNHPRARNLLALILVGSAAVLAPRFLRPDALVITRAMLATTISEIWVEQDSVVVEFEIGSADIQAFRNLLPDELYARLGHEPEPWIDRLTRFVAEDFVVRADGGSPAPGRLRSLEVRQRLQRDQVTGEALPKQPEEAENVVFARLAYPIPGRPAAITIGPGSSRSAGDVASIGFVVYHGGLHVNDFRYLGQPERLVLDWADPWYSQFENRNLWRQYRSPISAFLYVEPFEVRKEIVVRPRDLAEWGLDLGLQGRDAIPVAEQEEIKRRVAEFLAERNPVIIDGEPAEGFLERIHFIYRNLRSSGVIQPPRDLDAVSATLGVIWVYPVSGLPGEVEMTWDLFTDRVDRIPSAATDEAGSLPYFLSPDDRVLRWENFLTNPTVPGLVPVEDPPGRSYLYLAASILSLALLLWMAWRLVGEIRVSGRPAATTLAVAAVAAVAVWFAMPAGLQAVRMSDEDTQAVLTGLLLNVYKSFDYRDEEAIYDALARTASGDLLTDIYLETRRSLELANQGGARAKVRTVEVREATNESLGGEPGFRTRATWDVEGSVGHWGHVHQRLNQYEAELTVRVVDGVWKITELAVLTEERLPTSATPGAGSTTPPGGGM
jgi:hypothetical protein